MPCFFLTWVESRIDFFSSPKQEWKDGIGKMGTLLPKYKPTPEDDTPITADVPTLAVFVNQDGALVIPAETRALYLQDVVRAPEWRKILQDFDKKWGTVSTSTPTPSTATPVQEVSAAPGPSEVPSDAQPQSGSSWEGMFPEEPTNMDALTQTYGPGAHTFTVTSTLTAIVVEGPKLFLVGNGTATFNTDEPILMFGGGSWILDARAETFMQAMGLSKYALFFQPPSLDKPTSENSTIICIQTNPLHLCRKTRTRATSSCCKMIWSYVF